MTYRTKLLSKNNMMLSVVIILHYVYCLNLEAYYNDKCFRDGIMLGKFYLKVVMPNEGECLGEITYWNNNK